MAMTKNQLLEIIRPVLTQLDLEGLAAENLLLGTCAQESQMGYYRKQINGPALGIYQMEPATHDSIWNDYLKYNNDLAEKVNHFSNGTHDADQLIDNDQYATAMARVRYSWIKAPLPDSDDILGLAQYYKKYYNTPKGKATVEQFVDNYKKYVL